MIDLIFLFKITVKNIYKKNIIRIRTCFPIIGAGVLINLTTEAYYRK